MSSNLIITIDGPAGAGKTSVSKAVAARLGLPVLDTGALYRALALQAQREGLSWSEGSLVASLSCPVELQEGRVLLAGEDVTEAVRAPDISQGASQISAFPEVRASLLTLQRSLGASGCVMAGRSTGTEVFPNADVKIFLTATLGSRARRRAQQLQRNVSEVLKEMDLRDTADSCRESFPLARPEGSIGVNSTNLTFDETVGVILNLCPSVAST